MAISHILGTAVANVSDFLGTAKANVSEILGATASFGGGGGPDPTPKSLVFCCGFECGQIGDVGQHWSHAQGATSATMDSSLVRSGSRSMHFNYAASSGTMRLLVNKMSLPGLSVHRFYIRFITLPSADTGLIWFGGSSTGIGLGFKQSTGTIHCISRNAGLNFAGSGISVTTGVWYRIDAKLDNTAGAKVADGQVDGVALTQQTAATVGSTQNIDIGSTASVTGEWVIDDYAVSQTSGDYPIGAGYVNHFVPVSDGVHNTGTAGNFKEGASGSNITNSTTTSYQLIDEVPIDDVTPDTNDYINMAADTGATTNYVEHVIGPASGISTPTLGPRSIEVMYGYHQQNLNGGAHEFKINDNGSEDAVQTFNAAGETDIRYHRKHYVDPPSAAAAWTTATGNGNFNNLRTRFGYSNDGNPDQYLDFVIVEAEFSV